MADLSTLLPRKHWDSSPEITYTSFRRSPLGPDEPPEPVNEPKRMGLLFVDQLSLSQHQFPTGEKDDSGLVKTLTFGVLSNRSDDDVLCRITGLSWLTCLSVRSGGGLRSTSGLPADLYFQARPHNHNKCGSTALAQKLGRQGRSSSLST